MQDLFDPETMLLSDEFLKRYERALQKLPKRELYVWLLYRKGLSTKEIASALMSQQRLKRRTSKRAFDIYRKRVERMLKEIQKELKTWCLGKKGKKLG